LIKILAEVRFELGPPRQEAGVLTTTPQAFAKIKKYIEHNE
jgi:hypothetical protein